MLDVGNTFYVLKLDRRIEHSRTVNVADCWRWVDSPNSCKFTHGGRSRKNEKRRPLSLLLLQHTTRASAGLTFFSVVEDLSFADSYHSLSGKFPGIVLTRLQRRSVTARTRSMRGGVWSDVGETHRMKPRKDTG